MSSLALRQRLMGSHAARTVLSVWGWLSLGILVILWTAMTFVVWIVTTPFDRDRYWTGFVFRRVCVAYKFLNPMWTFTTSGRTITDPRRPYVVVSNHESFVDMIAISQLPWEMKWISKEDFFRFPFLGWMMMMANDIKLVRGNRESIVSAMKGSRERLDQNLSVMVFPEGTRSQEGQLGEVKDGAVRLAIEQQCPILPLALVGAREALVKGSWKMNVTHAEVRVLDPIETTGMSKDDIPALRDRTRDLIAAAIAEMKA